MSLSTTSRKAGPYAGDAVTTVFAYAFKVFATSDLVVIKAAASGAETTGVLGVDYTVLMNADQDAAPGGTVTMTVAPAVGEKLVITTAVSALQSTTLLNGGGFFPSVLNALHDRVTIFAQELREKISRAITIPITAAGVTSLQIPVTPNGIVAWNSGGTALTADPNAATVSQVGQAGKLLTTDGAVSSWTDNIANFRINTLLRFGGVTNLFTALKPAAAILQARLADDSGFAEFQALGFRAEASSAVYWNSRTIITSPADSVLLLRNQGGNNFDRLQFGGVTNAFPAIQRSSTGFLIRLADDTAYTFMRALNFRTGSGTIIADSADGNLLITDSAGATFTRMMLGGATSAFPAIKRNGTALDFRLADDSGFCQITAGPIISSNFTFYFGPGRGQFSAPADGVIQLLDNAATSFARLCLGGTTSAFPALKRTTTQISIRLADDSGDADLLARDVVTSRVVRPGVFTVGTLPAAATAGQGARAMVTDANATTTAGIGTTVAAGGANIVPVYSDGTNWKIG